MYKCSLTSICLSIFLNFLLAVETSAEELRPDRLIEIELDAVIGAKQYELRFTSLEKPPLTPLTFKMASPVFSQKIPLGPWRIEVRSYDHRDVPGHWVGLGDVDIKFKPPTLQEPQNNATISSTPDTPVTVQFNWSAFSDQAEFQIILFKNNSKTPLLKKSLRGATFSTSLTQGVYHWALKSTPPGGVALDGQDPDLQSFTVNAGQLNSPNVDNLKATTPTEVKWTASPHAETYGCLLERIANGNGNELSKRVGIYSKELKSLKANIPDHLDAGTYEFQIIAKANGFDESKPSKVTFKIAPPTPLHPSPAELAAEKKSKDEERRREELEKAPKHAPVSFIQGTMGPVLWDYSFSAPLQNFHLVAATITAIEADINKWFAVKEKSAWAIEVRGRQTNIYLFQGGDPSNPGQDAVTVSDRRIALIGRRRQMVDRVGLDLVFGVGPHHYTYLIQDKTTSVINSLDGNLTELYLGGAIDWQLLSGQHASLDLGYHPIMASGGLKVDKSVQYTISLKYLKRVFHDRSFFSVNVENFRSRVDTESSQFDGTAQTVSTWYRLGLGLALKL